MGRSMSLVTPASLKNIPSGSHFNERLNRNFEAFSLDGKLFQSESGDWRATARKVFETSTSSNGLSAPE